MGSYTVERPHLRRYRCQILVAADAAVGGSAHLSYSTDQSQERHRRVTPLDLPWSSGKASTTLAESTVAVRSFGDCVGTIIDICFGISDGILDGKSLGQFFEAPDGALVGNLLLHTCVDTSVGIFVGGTELCLCMHWGV